MAWEQGLSWTKGYNVMMLNPDGTDYHAVGKPGPFFYIHKEIPLHWYSFLSVLPYVGKRWFSGPRWFDFYVGWRPTPGYSPLQDDHWHTRFLARAFHIGYTNYGMAFRPWRKWGGG